MSFENVSQQQLKEKGIDIDTKIGDLSSLSTTEKSSLVGAVNELFTSVSNGKVQVASAITDKGVTTASDAGFSQMANNISNIPTGSANSKCFKKTFESKITTTGWVYFNEADTDIAAHINDPTFVVTIINITDFNVSATRTIAVTATNHITNSYNSNASYGMLLKASSSGVTGYGGVNKAVNVTTPASGGSQICVTSDGKIGIYASSSTVWEAGTYVVLCGW